MGNSIAMKCGTAASVKAKCKEQFYSDCNNDRNAALKCVQKEAMKLVPEDFAEGLLKSFRTSDVKGFVTSIKRFAVNNTEFYKAALDINEFQRIQDLDDMASTNIPMF